MKKANAFTRVELVAVVAGVALLCAVALPLLGSTRSEAENATCLNNLRQIGRAVQMWGADHGNQPPWRTPVSQGGTKPETGVRPGNVWFEFAFMSNEVVTPRILACPADVGVITANNFSDFVTPSFRRNATSYLINVHTSSELPRSVLSGDRNVRALPGVFPCSISGINGVRTLDGLAPSVGWTNAVHGVQGNVVLMDGSVSTTTSEEMRQAFRISEEENGSLTHLIMAR